MENKFVHFSVLYCRVWITLLISKQFDFWSKPIKPKITVSYVYKKSWIHQIAELFKLVHPNSLPPIRLKAFSHKVINWKSKKYQFQGRLWFFFFSLPIKIESVGNFSLFITFLFTLSNANGNTALWVSVWDRFKVTARMGTLWLILMKSYQMITGYLLHKTTALTNVFVRAFFSFYFQLNSFTYNLTGHSSNPLMYNLLVLVEKTSYV